eukprot:g2774.t1
MLTGGLILVDGSSVAQLLLGIIVCLGWLLLVAFKRPYRAYWDNILSMVLSLHLLFTLISGMALKMYRIQDSDDAYEQALFDWILVLMTVLCMFLGVFALIITIPCLRNRLSACKTRKKKENVRKFAHEWVENQRVLMKWLSLKKLEKLLKEVENKMEKEVALVVSNKKFSVSSSKKRTTCCGSKDTHEKVYPASILERIKKTKVSTGSVARTQMLIHKRIKRLRNKQKLLPIVPKPSRKNQANDT